MSYDSDDEEMGESSSSPVVPEETFTPFSTSLCVMLDPALSGDRVILPPSVLESILGDQELKQPVLTFSFTAGRRKIYGGVRAFSSGGECRVSQWMSDALGLRDGDLVQISRVSLPKAQGVTLRPLSKSISRLGGTDLRTVLEDHIRRHFATLTAGELLPVKAITRSKEESLPFIVESVRPSNAGGVLCIDVDVDLIIEAPLEEGGDAAPSSPVASSAVVRLPLATRDTGRFEADLVVSQPADATRIFEIPLPPVSDWQLDVELSLQSGGDCELYASTSSRAPSKTWHAAFDVSRGDKALTIRSADVHGPPSDTVSLSVVTYGDESITYKLSATFISGGGAASADMSAEPAGTASATEALPPGSKICSNCGQAVPERTLTMHENFCLRNNKKCDRCGAVLLAKAFSNHWHCSDCDFVGVSEDEKKHRELMHTRFDCACGRPLFLREVARHTSAECPERIISCPYCHLFCGQAVKIMHVASHARVHQIERASRPPLALCANVNCDKTPANNVLKLCGSCFSPFYSPNVDPGNKKLLQRVIRQYFSNLSNTPCKLATCANEFCSNGVPALPANEAALRAVELAKKSALFEKASPEMWLCVEGSSPAKRAQKVAAWSSWRPSCPASSLACPSGRGPRQAPVRLTSLRGPLFPSSAGSFPKNREPHRNAAK
ncbi:ubiquitin fusion degradation protein UFD1-domain-containing protein [Hyaloraphidium curvatum]|nr:ubiquitin fusion degradation protein UFD1-domain-containing protein [Hyaloraphidium curvatum]